jgi:hypothetical protein
MELFVQYNSICVDSYREDCEYGDWSETYSFDVKGVTIESRGRWSGLAYDEDRINVGFEAEAGTPVHVLWMTYSNGDSFGHGSGYGEILWVFKDPDVATKALKIWKEQSEQFSITIKDETGKEIQLSNPGAGYFESVDSLQVDTFLLSP